jgi:hypothetical protein
LDRGERQVLLEVAGQEQEDAEDRDARETAGELRPDIDVTDIPLIQLMLTAVMEYTDDIAPEAWRRYLAVVLDGLRTGGAQTPLPAAALTDEQLDGAMARGLRPPPRR